MKLHMVQYENFTCIVPRGKWDICNIETVQLRFVKHILGVNTSATNNLVGGELGQFPLKSFTHFKSVEFYKCMFKSENQVLKSCLEIDKQLNTYDVPDTIPGYIKNLSQNIAGHEKSILIHSKNKVKKLIKKTTKKFGRKNTELQLSKGKPYAIRITNLKNILK